jgi:hypothetical protein
MARIDEIAPDLFRISIYVPQIDLQFNHFRPSSSIPACTECSQMYGMLPGSGVKCGCGHARSGPKTI